MNGLLTTLAYAALALGLGFAVGRWWQEGHRRLLKRWPSEFKLNARPVFTTDERLLYKELKNALPNHVVLAKINLLRFCQSANDRDARLWFERLQALNVSFAICTINGTVISVIDIETPHRTTSARNQKLKEAVLETCRVRYVRCMSGHWPRPALLASWALGGAAEADAAHGHGHGTTIPGFTDTSPLALARTELAQKLHQRRAERASRFQDSTFASDSFFATDSRFDSAANSGPIPLESEMRIAKAKAALAASAARG
jgi:hypothetical protein